MAPVLFLFLMTAFAELFDKEYDRNNSRRLIYIEHLMKTLPMEMQYLKATSQNNTRRRGRMNQNLHTGKPCFFYM
jgi:hypothetical protein